MAELARTDQDGQPHTPIQDDVPIQDEIHDGLDYWFNSLSLPWKGSLKFRMHVGNLCARSNLTKDIDICAFVSGESRYSQYSPFAYFNRSEFPYETGPYIATSLHMAILRAAVDSGFQLVSNGRSYSKSSLANRKKYPLFSTPPIGSVTYVCVRYDTYCKRGSVTAEGTEGKYRAVTLHNNARGNSRGLHGKKGPRKCSSSKAMIPEDTCGFRIQVFWDLNGYYIQRGSGNTTHCKHMRRHPKDIPTSIRQYSAHIKKQLGELSKGRLTAAAGRNYLHSLHGITSTLAQVRHAFKVFDADSERTYFGEQVGATGLLGWLEQHKDETSYCVWQARLQDTEVPSLEREASLIFNEDTVDGETSITDLSEKVSTGFYVHPHKLVCVPSQRAEIFRAPKNLA